MEYNVQFYAITSTSSHHFLHTNLVFLKAFKAQIVLCMEGSSSLGRQLRQKFPYYKLFMNSLKITIYVPREIIKLKFSIVQT